MILDEEIRVSLHEAAHAIVADALGVEVKSVSAKADDESNGRCAYEELGDLETEACIAISGWVSDFVLCGRNTNLRGSDLKAVHSCVCKFHGYYVACLGESGFFHSAYQRAKGILISQRSQVERLAARLRAVSTMTGEQVRELLHGTQRAIVKPATASCATTVPYDPESETDRWARKRARALATNPRFKEIEA